MFPTLEPNELLLVSKMNYWRVAANSPVAFLGRGAATGTGARYVFGPPRRGDVIVFVAPLDPGRDYIKRVIGLPGDVIDIKDGQVWVNGKRLQEPYTHGAPTEVNPFGKAQWVVSTGKYFVMGDNRGGSSDSRDWGLVPLDNIVGKAVFTYWPFDKWGTVPMSKVQLPDRRLASLPRAA